MRRLVEAARKFRVAAGGEQAMMANRLLLAAAVLAAASLNASAGTPLARDFFRDGLPWLQVYLLATGAIQAHILLWPRPNATRQGLTIACDAAVISLGLSQGGGASAYLFPLYFWVILGNGVRLGARTMGTAVAGAAAGFAATVAFTPFWRDNGALSVGLFLSIVIIPVYGALLLRRGAEASAEAARANHAKTLLLASVSHELRTPLTAIVGLGDLLQNTGLDEEQREMAQTMTSAAGIMMRHIEALLTVSRDEIGPRRAPERVDLLALLMSLRALLAVEADKKGVRLGLCIDAQTPSHVWAEPGVLLDVLQNLGGNAVKFTTTGAVAIELGVARSEPANVILRVRVHDTGIGVDKEAQRRIFESFNQADPDIARRYGGSGLGLAIARRRLQACGGRIGVESELGAGAIFWFELGVGVDAQAASASPAPQEKPPRLDVFEGAPFGTQIAEPICLAAAGPVDALALARRFALAVVAREDRPADFASGRNMVARLREFGAGGVAKAPPARPLKILLAEDNGVNRMVLNKILTQAGHATVLAVDGEAALKAMVNECFDVILLDVNMPGISGVEAARLYRFAAGGGVRAPILALTADASPACREQCAQSGMVDCLTKPILPEALLRAVAAAVSQSEAAASRKVEIAGREAAAKASPASPGALDAAALDALAALGGEDFLRDLILNFVDEGGAIVQRMIVAVEQGDQHAFQREAHALSSSAGNLGARELARLCRSWCELGPGWAPCDGDHYLEELRREWSLAALALANVLAGRRAGAARRRGPSRRRGGAAA